MPVKRIIPALDIQNGRVVKGVQFENVRDIGDPVERAAFYAGEGADEIVFLDISASHERRKTASDLAAQVCAAAKIPFTVGGGIKSMEDVAQILNAGADKIFINTAAFETPELVREAAQKFGSQRIVIAVDAKQIPAENNSDQTPPRWDVFLHGGRTATGKNVVEWAQELEELGAGEILLTSMDGDGTQTGYDVALTRAVAEAVSIPVVASGGAGNIDHIYEVLTTGKADAALVASLVHYGKYSIAQIKTELKERGVEVRI